MKINDLKMATPIEEKIDQNLKVSLIDGCVVNVIVNMNFVFLGRFLTSPHGNDNGERWQK